MTDGFALAGAGPAPPRRGRPPGSKNKRAGDLVGFLDAKCGGTAALQLAQGCMVTVAEVKAAGSLQAAELAKARRMVEAFEAERERLAGRYRDLVWEVLEATFAQAAGLENADEVRKLVGKAVSRLEGAIGGQMTLRDALERMGEDRRALLPYTDQKQAQRVEVDDKRAPPVMVLVGGSVGGGNPVQLQSPVIDATFEVLQSKSHDGEEA
jgi:hypothetical protein